jgi:hypothetical protein
MNLIGLHDISQMIVLFGREDDYGRYYEERCHDLYQGTFPHFTCRMMINLGQDNQCPNQVLD